MRCHPAVSKKVFDELTHPAGRGQHAIDEFPAGLGQLLPAPIAQTIPKRLDFPQRLLQVVAGDERKLLEFDVAAPQLRSPLANEVLQRLGLPFLIVDVAERTDPLVHAAVVAAQGNDGGLEPAIGPIGDAADADFLRERNGALASRPLPR